MTLRAEITTADRRRTTGRVLGVVTAISAAAVLAGPTSVAVPGGLLLAFALPGVALTGVLFRGRDLSGVERVVLAPAMSLATLIIAGLLMNAVGIGLDRASWTAATAGVTLLALFAGALPTRTAVAGGPAVGGTRTTGRVRETVMAAAFARAAGTAALGRGAEPPVFAPDDTVRLVVIDGPNRSPDDQATSDDDATRADAAGGNATPAGGGTRPLWRQLLPLVLAFVVAGGAGWLSYDSSRTTFDRPVTTLSATPPGAPAVDGSRSVTVAVSGLPTDGGPYTIDMRDAAGRRLDGRIVTPVEGSWTVQVSVPGGQRVTINLLRAGGSTPYRTVIVAAAP